MAADIYKSIKVPLKYIIKNDIDYNLFHKLAYHDLGKIYLKLFLDQFLYQNHYQLMI